MKPSKALKIMRDGNEIDTNYGICRNYIVTCMGDDLETVMSNYGISFEDWPLYSGSLRYPVFPAMSTGEDAYFAYINQPKWDKFTEYGRNRWALLDWLIEQFELKGA